MEERRQNGGRRRQIVQEFVKNITERRTTQANRPGIREEHLRRYPAAGLFPLYERLQRWRDPENPED